MNTTPHPAGGVLQFVLAPDHASCGRQRLQTGYAPLAPQLKFQPISFVQTASQYLYLWKRRGLVQALGGHSDVYANLLASRHPDWEGAVVMAMPSAVLVGIEALCRSGWTTQLVQRPTVAVKSGYPMFKTDHFDLVTRDPHWFDQVAPGIEGSAGEGLRTLRPAWALVDLLHDTGWEHSGLSPDDIEWPQAAGAERDWRAARKAFGLAPVALSDISVPSRAHQPGTPVARQHRPLRRQAKA